MTSPLFPSFTHTCSPLHIAMCVHAVNWLYKMLKFVLFPYQTNITPLYVASQNGDHEVVQSLLAAGANVDITTSTVS